MQIHVRIYLRLKLVRYLAELRYEGYSVTSCISIQSPSCTWHIRLQQKKQNLTFAAPLTAPESATVLEATDHWNGESETARIGTADLRHVHPHCFLTDGPHIIHVVSEAVYVVIILSDNCRLPLPVGWLIVLT